MTQAFFSAIQLIKKTVFSYNTKKENVVLTEEAALPILTRFFSGFVFQSRIQKDQKRRNILRELIETEKNYCESLRILEQCYHQPLEQSISSPKPLITSTMLTSLFGNIDEITLFHRTTVLNSMNQLSAAIQQPFPEEEVYLKFCKDLFTFIPNIERLYSVFFPIKAGSDAIIEQLKKHVQFRKFIAKQLFNPETKCQELEDLLILPTQRIGSVKLLLERFLKTFTVPYLTNAQEQFKLLVKSIADLGIKLNAVQDDEENFNHLIEIAETISGLPPWLVITKPGRRYILEMEFHSYDKNTGFLGPKIIGYLLSDLVILGEVKKTSRKRPKIAFLEAAPAAQVCITKCPVDVLDDVGFVLRTDIRKHFLMTEKPTDKDVFLAMVRDTRHNISTAVKRLTDKGITHMKELFTTLEGMYSPENLSKPPKTRQEALEYILASN